MKVFLSLLVVLLCAWPLLARQIPASPREFFAHAKSSGSSASLLGGAVTLNGSLPIGVPLAGYNHGQRRVPDWPLPKPLPYTFWMTPSTGRKEDTLIRALVLRDTSVDPPVQMAMLTYDAIGADGGVNEQVMVELGKLGSSLRREEITFSGSHTHSGPGAISSEHLWEIAPATDLLKEELRVYIAQVMAHALYTAEKQLQPVAIAAGHGEMPYPVTQNRRSGISPWLHHNSTDPQVSLLRVDTVSGQPLALLWNFAIHGVCYGPDNMELSSDIMGKTSEYLQGNITGISAVLFVNADAGDIDPGPGMCSGAPDFHGAQVMSSYILARWKSMQEELEQDVSLHVSSLQEHYGPTQFNLTLERLNNCTHGGPLDICSLCTVLECDLNLHLSDRWVENAPWFTAFVWEFRGSGKKVAAVTMPGEPLSELGTWVRGDTLSSGYDDVFLFGYSQSHMGYFATPREYDLGGYESTLTMWGVDTAVKVRESVQKVVAALK